MNTPAPSDAFEQTLFAATPVEKLKRSLELGPKYFLWDVPKYFSHRRRMGLPAWDAGVFVNPLREFRRRSYHSFPLPPKYSETLAQLAAAGVKISMPEGRLEGLAGAWWSSRHAEGAIIECGAYRGATSLFLALLAKNNGIHRSVQALDTFCGMPATSALDSGRRPGEYAVPTNQVETIRRQAFDLRIDERLEIHQGTFAETFSRLARRDQSYSFIHIDANIYQGTREACEFTFFRASKGSVIVFDDYNGVCDLGARLAIESCLSPFGIRPMPLAGCSAFIVVDASLARATVLPSKCA